jgi:RpiR family transcriptional regulator, carbohydrate utilization regulator
MASKRRVAGSRRMSPFAQSNDAADSTDLFSFLRSTRISLPNNQERVARLLLDEPHWFVRASVSEIAARLQISAPTIVRFARKAGYEGLRDLKLQLAGAMAVRESAAHVPASSASDADGVIKSLSSWLTTVLANWRSRIDRGALDRAAAAIQRAKQIMCFGSDPFSNLLAQKLHGELYQFGYGAHSLSDVNYQLAAATTLTADDVLIVISLPGHALTLLSAIEVAKMRGVAIVAMTGDGSPLAERSDIVLPIDVSRAAGTLQGIEASLLQTITIETLIMLVGPRQSAEAPAHPSRILSIAHES